MQRSFQLFVVKINTVDKMWSTDSSPEEHFLQTHGEIDKYEVSSKTFLHIKTPRREGLKEELKIFREVSITYLLG